MNLHLPFFNRKHDETAELRDRLIVAETQVLLLRDLVDHPPVIRPRREIRKDAGSYREQAAKRKAELIAYRASLSNPVREEA